MVESFIKKLFLVLVWTKNLRSDSDIIVPGTNSKNNGPDFKNNSQFVCYFQIHFFPNLKIKK
jgi:hypothetical protein